VASIDGGPCSEDLRIVVLVSAGLGVRRMIEHPNA
jgi:hypothetical protein